MGDSKQPGPATTSREGTLTEEVKRPSDTHSTSDVEEKKVYQNQNDALDLHIKTHPYPFNDKELLDKNADA